MSTKIIHYCWFGRNKLPESVKKYMSTWTKFCPEYIIKEWNEDNFDIDSIPYVKEAYENKKYAFVSDYVRLYALYNEGGLYLDTDVEITKDLNFILNNEESVMGFEDKSKLSTAFIYSKPHKTWIKELLEIYATRHFISQEGTLDLTTNVEFITNFLKDKGLKQNGKEQFFDGIKVYPSEYFSPYSWDDSSFIITDNTYSIHHFAGTWHSWPVRFLSKIFSHSTVTKIASIKETLINIIR